MSTQERRRADRRKVDRKQTWRWRALTVWIVIFTAVVVYGVHSNRVLSHKGAIALKVQCQARDDLHRRIKNEELLLKPGHDIPLGITRATVVADLANKKSAYQAQRILDPYCERGEVRTP